MIMLHLIENLAPLLNVWPVIYFDVAEKHRHSGRKIVKDSYKMFSVRFDSHTIGH